MMNHLMSKNKKKVRLGLTNGGILLEELIASFDGKTNPIRCFSSDQILKATDNFSDSRVISKEEFILYRGVIEDKPVSIKKWLNPLVSSPTEACHDISMSSQMSGLKNSLKLLGCCLEFESPVLVCEYTEHGPLDRYGIISSGEVLPWKIRLKIAKEIAIAVTYLHTAFPEIIIHRDIKLTNIFIDTNWTAKLSGYRICIAIPEGELYVEDNGVVGSIGSLDPDYSYTGQATEKVDIYSFGVLMLVLLSGKAALFSGPNEAFIHVKDHVCELLEKGGFEEIVDTEIWNAQGDDRDRIRSQVYAFLDLALRCVRYNTDEPLSGMIEVAKELKLIEKFSS